MKLQLLTPLMLVFMLSACVSAPTISNFDRGVSNLNDGNFEAAYRFFENPSTKDNSVVSDLLRSRPEIAQAGANTFSRDALKESTLRYGKQESFRIELKRLEFFRSHAGPNLIEIAELNFASEFDAELAAHQKEIAEKARIAKLPEAEIAQYWADRYKKWEESVNVYGRVLSAQLINESRTGSNVGSQLGALVGQSAYIDSRNIFNYSALGQLQAGLLGGVLGGITNTAPATIYRKVYFLEIGSEVKRVDIVDSSQVLFPTGVCIVYREPFSINLTTDGKCVSNKKQ
jgi:hypothetical protein